MYIREYYKKWAKKHKKERIKYYKKWWQKHRKKRNKCAKNWRKKNKEHIKNYKKPININSRFNIVKRSAQNKGIEFSLTKKQFITFWRKSCYYCGENKNINGLDRVNNLKGYTIKNIVSCCRFCNMMKSNHTQEEFFEQCKKIVKNLNL